MPERSFAIDSWANGLLFCGFSNQLLREWLETHRCAPRNHTYITRWQLGPEFTLIEFQCQSCHQLQSMAVRTPFDLFKDPIQEYLKDGWESMNWETPIAAWQLQHKGCLTGSPFVLARSLGQGKALFSLLCPCGRSSPGTSWPLEARPLPEALSEEQLYFANTVQDSPEPIHSRVFRNDDSSTQLIRHRATGRVYSLPAFTLVLEPLAEGQPVACQVANLWSEFDRFYDNLDPERKTQTWHERLAQEPTE